MRLAVIGNQAFSLVNFRGPLIREMVRRGSTVYALAPDYDEQTRNAVASLGAEPVDFSLDRTGMRPWRDTLDFLRLYRLLLRLRPDATFSYFIKPVIYGSVAARFARVPSRYALVAGLGYVFTSDGEADTLKRRMVRRTVALLYKAAFDACNRVFFQNDEDVAYFVKGHVIEPKKAYRIAGTGVDLDYLTPKLPVTMPVTFLFMGRLLRAKGIREFVDAARSVKAQHPNVRFILLGGLDPSPDGFSRAEVECWAQESIVEWPGEVSDVRPWIAQSSVYVLPSYREGLPRSTQEAMAMGRAAITTDSVGCRETVEDGVNGFLVPVRDSKALAAAMLRFIDEPALIVTMGRESRRIAEERFDVHRINSEILEAMGIPSFPGKL